MVEGSVGLLLDAQRSRSAYLKALDWAGGGPTDEYEQFRSQLLADLGELFLQHRDDIVHTNPEVAVRIGLRGVLGVVDAEFRAVRDRLPRETLIEECRGMLLGYLTGHPGRGSGERVDFFEVWG